MKKLLFIGLISLLAIVMCDIGAQNNDYTASWNPNPEPDVSHYRLFVWSGADTTQCPFVARTLPGGYSSFYVKNVNHPTTTTQFTAVANGINYVCAALSAVDGAGNESTIAKSNFLLSVDLDRPGEPQNFSISE